jgi:hypothetical protein
MNKERLLKLADFLDKVSPEHFKLDCWAERGFRKNKCNTTACACGWATVCFRNSKDKLRLTNIGVLYYTKSGFTLYNFSAAAEFFDIAYNKAFDSFHPGSYEKFHRGPKHVAKRIRKFVEQHNKCN